MPSYKSTKHIAVRRYQQIKKIEQIYPVEKFVVSIELLTTDFKNAKLFEEKLLKDYEAIFGELPPLNKQ